MYTIFALPLTATWPQWSTSTALTPESVARSAPRTATASKCAYIVSASSTSGETASNVVPLRGVLALRGWRPWEESMKITL
jgi:hypothetical protein